MEQEPVKIMASLQIRNTLGLHARPAALFVRLASSFSSEIILEKDGDIVNGKSLMGLLMLAAGKDSVIKITISGHDAEKALAAISELVENCFNEK